MGAADQGGGMVTQMLDKAAEGKAAAQANVPHLGSSIDIRVLRVFTGPFCGGVDGPRFSRFCGSETETKT